VPRRKIKHTKDSAKVGLLRKFLDREEVPLRQIYARVPAKKGDRFIEILDREGLSIYQGVELALDLLIQFYERQKRAK
jgi:hypothetical protein